MPHILLLEDDLVIGQSTKNYIERVSDHTVTWLDHGTDAQAALSEGHDYDCVLLDLNLPGSIQGLDLLKTLRAYDQTIPVIVITANDFYDVRVECLQAGATNFLAKPIELTELVARINLYLSSPTTPPVVVNTWGQPLDRYKTDS